MLFTNLQHLSKTFPIPGRTERDMIINVHWSSCKVHPYSCQILKDGQTDMMMLIDAFYNFANASKYQTYGLI